MSGKRVVITGRGAVSPYGTGCAVFFDGLWKGESPVVIMPEWQRISGLYSYLAAPVPDFDPKKLIPRKFRRTMGPMSIYATLASMEAAREAGLDKECLTGGETGVAIGSTTGSPSVFEEFYRKFLPDETVEDMRSGMFFKIMGHSCSANVSLALGIRGEQWAPASACTSAAQALGLGYMLVASGRQKVMLCGGADEVHSTVTMVFDVLHAASRKHDPPFMTPSPFDEERDGVVCGAGAGMLVLEEYEHAVSRGARIFAEIKGFGHVNDCGNVAAPGADVMAAAMKKAMKEAGVVPDDVDYVSAHATGTEQGDVAEGRAVAMTLGGRVAVSSLKGHIGHALGAAGGLETVALLEMMRREEALPTLNLKRPDRAVEGLNLLMGRPVAKRMDVVLKNNFALGGVNTSLVFRRI
jgi:3-oxoacyl-[acyl-carrier-protein] synthase II